MYNCLGFHTLKFSHSKVLFNSAKAKVLKQRKSGCNMQTRIEHDTMGEVEVPSEAMWGAQTQRSLQNFKIGAERLPRPMIRAMGLVEKRTGH